MNEDSTPIIQLRKPYRAYVVIEFDVPANDRGWAILPLEEAAQVARAAIQDACGERLEAMGIIAKEHYMEWDITAEARHVPIARLTQANAELAAEVERLKAEAAVYISFEIDRFEHDEDGSRNGQRHYYARIRYQAMAGCDYEEE